MDDADRIYKIVKYVDSDTLKAMLACQRNSLLREKERDAMGTEEMMKMASCDGQLYRAQLVRENPDGTWRILTACYSKFIGFFIGSLCDEDEERIRTEEVLDLNWIPMSEIGYGYSYII